MIGIQVGSDKVGIGAVSIRTPAGNVNIARVSMLTPDGDFVLFDSAVSSGALTLQADPPTAVGAEGSNASSSVETNTVTITPSGGTPPYTYSWTQNGSDPDWVIRSPLSRTTRFERLSVVPGAVESATFTCTVTDDRGRTGQAFVAARVYNFEESFL